ncbi:PKD/REJ-like domain [Trinorchestia longiramus]|nr:PKD/REJ-like domain [Trinorchestia longiramus]
MYKVQSDQEYKTLTRLSVLQTGPVTFIISAYNSVQGWVEGQPINVTFVNEIEGFTLTDDGVLGKVNVPKPVTSNFEVLPPISCLRLDWGDKTIETFGNEDACNTRYPELTYRGSLTSVHTHYHAYSKEGAYTVTGFASDMSKTVLDARLQVVVADVPCKMPNISIVDAVSKYYSAPTQLKSLPIRVQTQTIIECNKTVPVKRFWRIMIVNNDTGTDIRELSIENKLNSWNYSTLVVDPLFLDLGYYKFIYTVDIQASKVVALNRSVYTYQKIIRSNLSAAIMPGSIASLSRGYEQSIELTPGTTSIDPDAPGVPFTNVTWFCRQLKPALETLAVDAQNFPLPTATQPIPDTKTAVGKKGGGCFGEGPGMLSFTGVRKIFQISSFYLSEAKFEFTVVIRKDVRRAMAKLEIEVMAAPPPGVSLDCASPRLCLVQSDGKLINPSLRLSIAGSCTSYCASQHYYRWEVFKADGSPILEREPNCDPDFKTCLESFVTDTNLQTVIISPSLFLLNNDTETFIVKLSIITMDERLGYSQIVIKKNKPPKGGRCSISYDDNFCLLSKFMIACEKWQDPEAMGISTYNFHYFEQKADGTMMKTALATTSLYTLPATLPLGSFSIFVSIADSFGAKTEHFIGNVSTIMPTYEQVEAFNASAKLMDLSSAGDTVQLAMFIKALNSLTSNANWTDLSDESFENMNRTAQELLLQSIADSKADQLKSIKTMAPPTTIDEINVYTGVLRSSVSSILDNSASSLTVGMDAREDCLSSLERLTSSLPEIDVGSGEELETFARDTLGIMTALMEGMNSVLDSTDLLPPRDLQAAVGNKIDYDGAVINDPNAAVPDSIEGIYKQSVLESTKQQSIVQMNRMKKVIETMNNEVMKKLAKGETLATRDESGASVYMAKIGEETLQKGKTIVSPIDGNSSVVLPENFCPSWFIDEYSSCRKVFGLMFLTWPVITHYYPDSRKYLANRTNIIELVVTSDEKVVKVEDAQKPILISIPRDSETIYDPVFVNVSTTMNSVIPLVYHYYNISMPQSAYVIQIKPSSITERLVLIQGHEMFPVPGRFLFSYIVNDLPSYNGYRTLFIDSKKNDNATGRFVAGVGKLLNEAHPSNFTREDLDPTFSSNYEFGVIVLGCYFFNESSRAWSGNGLKVRSSNATHTKCETNHLSQFGSGFLPTVNEIDFNFLIANMGFIDNSTLYATFILLFVMLIIVLIWAHYKDKKDVERRGVIPLPDNNPQDKYVYEVTFVTGPDSDAPCESKIFFVVSGNFDETGIRKLPMPSRNLYRRYDRNTFVMTTSKPLGSLHYLRVFHDNSGRLPYDSWQLERVVFRDLQQMKQFTFETNSWLALNRGDGMIDRTFQCADHNEDLQTFSDKMYTHANKGVNQDHMWMSVFLRPIGSRFCRKERVLVCTTFLFVSMFTNAMFYQIEGESAVDALTYIGPIPIATSQIITGLLSILFVFPLTTLLSVIFKRARPRKNTRCLALDAIEKQRKDQLVENGVDEQQASEKCKVNEIEGTKPRPKIKPVVKCLPWWTRVLGWIVCGICIAASAFFVWSYGITWGEITTVKWFASFFTSFMLSILVAQWLKVAFASCLSSLCYTANLSIEDIDCDEELPHLKEDEEWAFMTPLDNSTVRKVHRVTGVTHDVEKTAKLSTKLTKERDMKFIVRGILIYGVFLAALLVIVGDRTDYSQFLMQQHLTNTFIKKKYVDLDMTKKAFTTNEFWAWTKKVLMNEIRVQRWYNNKVPYGLRGFLNDKANRIVGYPIIRQVRNGRFQCKVPYPINETVTDCTGSRGVLIEDHQRYCAAWVLVESFEGACNYEEFHYQTGDDLLTFTTIGNLGTYGPGGYVIRLKESQDDIIARLTELQRVQWIDKRTRVVFVEFSVYNANANLFALCVIAFEMNEGGGIVAKWSFEPVRLLRLANSFNDTFLYLCELFFLIATIFFTLRQLWEIKKQKCSYFLHYWNLAEISIVAASWVEIGLYFYKKLLTLDVLDEFNRTKGNEYVRMDNPVFVETYFIYVLGFLMFLSLLKLIKLLQFNKRMDVLALTISLCWDELAYFFIAFAVIFFAFCCLFYFMFVLYLPEFASLMSAIQTSFSMMLGKFEFEQMKQANALSPLLFFVFSVINSMILVNIMLSIILKAFNEVKIDLEKKENPYDVLDYTRSRFRKMLVLQPEHINQVRVDLRMKNKKEAADDKKNDLPDKVDQLLQYMNTMYFDGKLDMKNSQAVKAALGVEGRRPKRSFVFAAEKPRRVYCSD